MKPYFLDNQAAGFRRLFLAIAICTLAACQSGGARTVRTDELLATGKNPERYILQAPEVRTVIVGPATLEAGAEGVFQAANLRGGVTVMQSSELIADDPRFAKAKRWSENSSFDYPSARRISAQLRLLQNAGDLLEKQPETALGWLPDFWADALLNAPRYPGQPWRVHDFARPQPPSAPSKPECGRSEAPANADILWDESRELGFSDAGAELWDRSSAFLTASGKKNSRLTSLRAYGDVQIHLEFKFPNPPRGFGQYRGNGGVFLMGLYEVQILDSFDNPTYADGHMGALYGQEPPLWNAVLPADQWQCLDIDFKAPRFESNALVEPARATVRVNGIVVQDNAAFRGPTLFAALSAYTPHPDRLPLQLQDHGDLGGKIQYRRIWASALSNREGG